MFFQQIANLKTYKLLTLIIALFIQVQAINCYGQNQYSERKLKVGDTFPNFILNNVKYHIKENVSLQDFKGKWLILDFWNQYCTGCIKSFPKINSMQQKYAKDVKFLLIGITGSHFLGISSSEEINSIQSLYEKVRGKMGLDLSIAYDSILPRQLRVFASPYTIIIDPNGIVRGITYVVNEQNIDEFLNGRTPLLPKTYNTEIPVEYDMKIPFLTNGSNANGGIDTAYLFRSVLAAWNPSGKEFVPMKTTSFNIPGTFEVLGVDLVKLYMLAYVGQSYWGLARDSLYGRFWIDPILEIADSSEFKGDRMTGKNLYSYSLTLPKNRASSKEFMSVMQKDMEKYFNFEASIEERFMPYWSLITISDSSKEKLKTKSDSPYFKMELQNQGFEARNMSVESLIDFIHPYNEKMPIIDDTGINFNIDLKVNALMLDSIGDDMISSLKANGLNLVKSQKKMKVLIIRDKNKSQIYSMN